MKLLPSLIFSLCLLTFATSCQESPSQSPDESQPKVEDAPQATSPESGFVHPIDRIIQKVDAASADADTVSFGSMEIGTYVCEIQDVGKVKKYIFCFDGGMEAREIHTYYDEEDSTALFALFIAESYNASPANPEAFDEAQTTVRKVKLVFKDNSLDTFEQVMDMRNHPVEMDADMKEEWHQLTAAIPPF